MLDYMACNVWLVILEMHAGCMKCRQCSVVCIVDAMSQRLNIHNYWWQKLKCSISGVMLRTH